MIYFVPEEVEVAINPNQLILPGSFKRTQGRQEKMIKAHGDELKNRNPDLKDVNFVMPHASVAMQLDLAYWKTNGINLFMDRYVRTVDRRHKVFFVSVGRGSQPESHHGLLIASEALMNVGSLQSGAMPVAVLPRK